MLIKFTFTKSSKTGIVAYFTHGKIIKDTPQNLDDTYAIEITNLKTFDEPFIPEGINAPQPYKFIDFDLVSEITVK